ncbi:Protein of unknown function, partial [Gryllus bimaculatus]
MCWQIRLVKHATCKRRLIVPDKFHAPVKTREDRRRLERVIQKIRIFKTPFNLADNAGIYNSNQ